MSLQFDTSPSRDLLPEGWLSSRLDALAQAQDMLEQGSGPGGEFTGWVNLPTQTDKAELRRIKKAAAQIQKEAQALVVIGIGGSYLGARAVLELLHSPNYNLLDRGTPQIFFAGNTLSSDALNELSELLRGKDFYLNVISKSGSTLETSAAFLLFHALLKEKYSPDEVRRRILVTTDPAHGQLRALAEKEGYETFSIPGNIGGRYCVLTAAGILPLCVAGVDIDGLLRGAGAMREELKQAGPQNPAWQYAAARHAFYEGKKQVELLCSYEPSFRCFGEWWKQLFGESEGKEEKGLFPATAEFPADLHSMGQYIQEGRPLLFETIVCFEKSRSLCPLPDMSGTQPSLDFLEGRNLEFMNWQALRGTLLAHVDGGVPNLLLRLDGRRAVEVGQLLYFFQYACALSAYLLRVNPFDQPGVESYKANMLALMGKPEFAQRRQELEARLT